MGQGKSRRVSAVTVDAGAQQGDGSSPIDVAQHVSLLAPSAAVVGAGVAGVHVAYELAKLGFKVTVFEKQDEVAKGETQFSLPFVGVGLMKPSLARTAVRREILRGMLFPSTCPDLISREHLFNTVMNPVVYRWLWGRVRSCFSDSEVMCYTNHLSRISCSVVRDLVSKHPQLQEHVYAGLVTVLDEKQEPAVTAHAEPLMVNPVGWTRALAEVCRSNYGVQFALGERVEDTNTYLTYDVESTKSIRVSKPDPLDSGKRVFASERYDVVVLAAGASTGTMTLPNTRLPVLGLSGLSVVMQQPTGELRDALWSLFQKKPLPLSHAPAVSGGKDMHSTPSPPKAADDASSSSQSLSGTLALLSGRCSLYGYTWPRAAVVEMANATPTSATTTSTLSKADALPNTLVPPAQDYVLQGLLSLDSTAKDATPSIFARQLGRLESYLRVKGGHTVPLNALNTQAPSTAAASVQEAAHAGDKAHVHEYVRAFTPDGVPLVDHNGGAFNCFVCCGFGDQAMDFAPGAAKVLGKLVEHQAQCLREEDIANVNSWGVLTSKLTPSCRSEVEADLQSLFNGVLPESMREVPTLPSANSKDAPSSSPNSNAFLYFEMNPFSTNRFASLVPKKVKNVTTPSWLEQFYQFEDALLGRVEPYRTALNHRLTELAKRDNVPQAFRNMVFCYFYDEDSDPAAVEQKRITQERMRQLAATYEKTPISSAAAGSASDALPEGAASVADRDSSGTSGASVSTMERSKQREAEMERRARELFTKP